MVMTSVQRFVRIMLALVSVMFWVPMIQAQDPGGVSVVIGGWVFDTPTGTFQKNRGIQIVDGRFQSLDASLDSNTAAEFERDGKLLRLEDDQYVLPGLVDCHAHYNVRLFKRRREEFEVMPVVYLANGVTVTFSCG